MGRCVSFFLSGGPEFIFDVSISSAGNEDDLELAELQLAAGEMLLLLTGCHHCGAPSIEKTKGRVSVDSSSPRQTNTVAAS